ncbi:hypothetical protein [Phenylobacterium sp.]|uniref:hypothetical protein n=1 Tax=Phenylobacterium sp. TaxID=1871053 RepID=UPI00374D3A04
MGGRPIWRGVLAEAIAAPPHARRAFGFGPIQAVALAEREAEVTQARAAKLADLFRFYGVDAEADPLSGDLPANSWRLLCLAMAEDFVPGFQIATMPKAPPGRPRTPDKVLKLAFDAVEALSPPHSVARAAHLLTRTGGALRDQMTKREVQDRHAEYRRRLVLAPDLQAIVDQIAADHSPPPET